MGNIHLGIYASSRRGSWNKDTHIGSITPIDNVPVASGTWQGSVGKKINWGIVMEKYLMENHYNNVGVFKILENGNVIATCNNELNARLIISLLNGRLLTTIAN